MIYKTFFKGLVLVALAFTQPIFAQTTYQTPQNQLLIYLLRQLLHR